MKQAQILLADDNSEVLELVTGLLTSDFEVVGVASDGQTVLSEANRLHPDVLILDISMPLMDGIAVAAELNKATIRPRIVFLTIHEDDDFLQACLKAGGLGYVLKAKMVTDLVFAVREALADRIFVSQPLARST